MYNEKIEALISAALADGVLTEKEKQVLFKRAQAEGIDLDEFEMVLDARLVELQKAEKAKAEASAPKSTKYGDVRKCPACGSMIPALAGVCPECGYEFSGIDANLSSKKLADGLIAIDKECEVEMQNEFDKFKPNSWSSEEREGEIQRERIRLKAKYKSLKRQRKKTLIETFPIPNTKSDLFEFISSLQARMSGSLLAPAYRRKVKECLTKAKALYPTDPIFLKLVADVEEKLKKRRILYMLSGLGILLLLFCIIGLPILCKPKTPEKNKKVCIEMVNTAIAENNLSEAQRLIENYEKSSHKIFAAYDALLDEYVKNNDGVHVKSLIRTYTSKTREEAYEKKTHNVRFYNDLISMGEYNEAELYLDLPKKDFFDGNKERYETYLNHLSKCVSQMCARKQKKEARKFINEKVAFYQGEDRKLYDGKPNPWYPENVKARLNKVINEY